MAALFIGGLIVAVFGIVVVSGFFRIKASKTFIDIVNDEIEFHTKGK